MIRKFKEKLKPFLEQEEILIEDENEKPHLISMTRELILFIKNMHMINWLKMIKTH